MGAAVIRSPVLKCLARPTFPTMSVVPVIVPWFACPERSFIRPSERRVSMLYWRTGPVAGGDGARAVVSAHDWAPGRATNPTTAPAEIVATRPTRNHVVI